MWIEILQPRIAELNALFAVDAEKGVCTYGGREGQAALNPELNYLASFLTTVSTARVLSQEIQIKKS